MERNQKLKSSQDPGDSMHDPYDITHSINNSYKSFDRLDKSDFHPSQTCHCNLVDLGWISMVLLIKMKLVISPSTIPGLVSAAGSTWRIREW